MGQHGAHAAIGLASLNAMTSVSDAIPDFELRSAWRRLRMVGDFDTSMQHNAIRRAVESAARAMRLRGRRHEAACTDNKRRAANDADE